MTETSQTLDKSKHKKQIRSRKPTSELDDFRAWLGKLGMVSFPNIHVNGASHSMAVVTVDFGTPLEEPTKLTSDQNAELVTRMKTLTRALHKSEVNVRVQNDLGNGIWWTSVN